MIVMSFEFIFFLSISLLCIPCFLGPIKTVRSVMFYGGVCKFTVIV